MSNNKSLLVVIAMVIVVAGILVVSTVGLAARKVDAASAALNNSQSYAALSSYDAGTITIEQANAKIGNNTEVIAAWCELNVPTGNMKSVCDN